MLLSASVLNAAAKPAANERWIHPDGRAVTIPQHGGTEIGPPLFHKILAQLGITVEEFRELK